MSECTLISTEVSIKSQNISGHSRHNNCNSISTLSEKPKKIIQIYLASYQEIQIRYIRQLFINTISPANQRVQGCS